MTSSFHVTLSPSPVFLLIFEGFLKKTWPQKLQLFISGTAKQRGYLLRFKISQLTSYTPLVPENSVQNPVFLLLLHTIHPDFSFIASIHLRPLLNYRKLTRNQTLQASHSVTDLKTNNFPVLASWYDPHLYTNSWRTLSDGMHLVEPGPLSKITPTKQQKLVLTDEGWPSFVSSLIFLRGPIACNAVRFASRCRSSSISARCNCKSKDHR